MDDTLFMQGDVVPNIDVLMSGGKGRLVDERFSSIMGIYTQSLESYEIRVKDICEYRPTLPTLENDIAEKLQSSISSMPYFKLDVKMEYHETESSMRPNDTEEHPTDHRQMLPIPEQRAGNHMYFSFEGPPIVARSADKREGSKSKRKSSSKKDVPENGSSGQLRHLTNSNSRRPFVSLFSEEPSAEGSNSPSFKAL